VHLEGLKLNILSLRYSQLTDRGLKHIASLSSLIRLQLVSTQITDAGLVHLEGLKNLKHLNHQGSQITDAGVAKLRQVLHDCLIY